jgi:hypothetical protein
MDNLGLPTSDSSNATGRSPSDYIPTAIPAAAEKSSTSGGTSAAATPAAAADASSPAALADDKTPKSHINECDGFLSRFWEANLDVFGGVPEPDSPEPERRALPAPWASPPFPGSEWQGYPLVGVPGGSADSADGLLMKAIKSGPDHGETLKSLNIVIDGWVTASGNWSNAKQTNLPESYWVEPNSFQLDQLVLRTRRDVDTVQTDHVDWGFKSIVLFGEDYREMVAGGWEPGYTQLIKDNNLYGLDLTEEYGEVYIPGVWEGMVIRMGRWIACPDIETQYAPDNYLGSHSLLFTYDTYTQTGVMFTFKLTKQLMVQGAITAGTDMAPWYPGATPTGFAGVRWESLCGNDAVYTCLNNINSAEFRHFTEDGIPQGHDNYNYIVSTWEHKFNANVHTATEAYFMWQYNAELGGTPILGPVESYGGGGGDGTLLPGLSRAYGVLNYTEWAFTKQDYICLRNEWWKDERGMRSGFAGNYSSHTIGLSHNFNSAFQIRPEIGYYRNYDQAAFDNGTLKGLWQYGFDMTYHF